MELAIVYFFVGLLAAYALYLTFRGRNTGVADPVLGFLNVGGAGFAPLVQEDYTALGPIFSKVETATGHQVPKCNVLFIYADIAPDGSLGLGADVTVRHLAERAGACIAVLASSNSSEHTIAASKRPGPKGINIVWTIDRKEAAFTKFFKELFTRMKTGKSMPLSWNSIAPQYKHDAHDQLPATICQMEAGQVRFR